MTQLIGISGPIGSGKSTLAQGMIAILKLMNRPSVIIPFASGLKELGALYNDPYRSNKAFDYFYDMSKSTKIASRATQKLLEAFREFPVQDGIKPRKLYQYIGTEIGRDIVAKDIWIQDVIRRAKALPNPPHFVIADDLRFVNESQAVDIHVHITMDTPLSKALYAARKALLPAEYFFNDHPSEKEQLLFANYTLELSYTPKQVIDLVLNITNHDTYF